MYSTISTTDMKLQEVHIKEFKVLEDIESYPEGKNILLIGDNGVGKSSFIQAIKIALGSKDVPPIKKGEWSVEATDKDGNPITFKAKVKDGKAKVTIEMNGMKDSRVGTLKQLVGDIGIDPQEFVEMSKTETGRKKQIEIFKGMFPEDVVKELDDHKANIQALYEERTDLNRDVKYLKTDIEKHPMHGKNAKDVQRVDVSAVLEKIEEANKHNDVYDRSVDARNAIEEEQELNKDRIKQLKEQLKKAQEEGRELEQRKAKADKWLSENNPIDTSELKSDLKHAEELNRQADKYEEYMKKEEQLEEKQEEVESMTVRIETMRAEVERFIREDMESPVPGLTFDDEQLMYNGTPVHPESLSTSEIIELGIKMTMAQNPDLGILFIEHGESIGKKRMEDILDIAKKNDWQIVMEQVERGTEKLTIEIINDEA